MTTDGRYIYGFIRANKQKTLGPIGIEQAEVLTFPYQDVSAVISDLPFMEFESLPKETLLRNLAIYQTVIEKVMKDEQIIPMKFGTMARSEEELNKILESGYGQINTSLGAMKNKIEVDVAALWSDLKTVLREMGEEEEIKRLKEEIASKPSDQIYEAKINLGKMVKASLDRKREECASEILDVLKKESEDHRNHDIMDDSMIMNAAFLINRDREDIFEGKVKQLDGQYEGRINFRIVGPLPPYSFHTLEIKRAEFAEINEARETLGLADEATSAQIREAYRELSKKLHPDKFPGDLEAQKRFEKINKAYQVLSDYCREGRCLFKEADVREWIAVRRSVVSGQ